MSCLQPASGPMCPTPTRCSASSFQVITPSARNRIRTDRLFRSWRRVRLLEDRSVTVRPHWRKMTWAIVIFTIVMFAWMIGGGSSAGSECNDVAGHYANAKQAGCETGTAIGVAALFALWFVGFVALSLIWFMTRPRGRDCPACGEKVDRGSTTCSACNFDLAASARGEGHRPNDAPHPKVAPLWPRVVWWSSARWYSASSP